MTYSIVARDPDTGQLGVAVQSHWFSVGTVVTWGEPGVGVVATQATAEIAHGPRGLALMREGRDAAAALKETLALDPQPQIRQVAMVDARGNVAAHTGESCIAAAGHAIGDGMSAQANMMLRPTVWEAMREAYAGARGDLADRLLAALDAAEAEGGDIRGVQSAAILVVEGEPAADPWSGRVFDVRVDDHEQPLLELRRLVGLRRAYAGMERADEALAIGETGPAWELYARAVETLGENPEAAFWAALARAATGDVAGARAEMARVTARDDRWRELLARLPATGMVDEAVVNGLLA